MPETLVGKPIKRNEDPRLLSGQALYVDDIHLPEMLHAAFYRSPYAHARIRSIDVSAVLRQPGVLAVFTAQDLGAYNHPAPLVVSPPPIKRLTFAERTQFPLAKDKVRYVGEPVAVVIAESRYLAEDALDAIQVEYELLPVVTDLEQALLPGAARIHDDLPDNVAAHVLQEKGHYDQAAQGAALVIRRRFHYDRGAAAAMENRGMVASWDRLSQRLTVWDTTQAPIPIRNGLATRLGLSENQVHLIAPFLGGGFGPKVMMFYSEEMVIPWVAMQIGRPVKWIEDRFENFYATSQERGQIHDAEMALSPEGIILGVKDVFLHDSGAYDPYGLTIPINSQGTLLGTYRVPNYYSEFKAVFTNRVFTTPYRGAGRQHGVFVMERLLDLAARRLGIDRAEIRRRNYLLPEDFPYNNEVIYQDFAPLVYDSGSYEPVLDQAMQRIGYRQFLQETQPALKAAGRKVGLGIVSYVEGTGIGPYEGARVQVLANGKVSVVTGVGTQGQGHFTSFAQIAADQLGVDVRDVEVVTGDTDQFHWGTGTFASRGAVVAGSAVHAAASQVRQKVLKLAASQLGASEDALELGGGEVHVRGEPSRCLTLGRLAGLANPLRGAVHPGSEPGLEATSYFGPEMGATACGVHALLLEVDPGTMLVNILKYVVVHDCGRLINPMIVAGQVHGGVAQGIGNAFYERLACDASGTLQNATLRRFLLPTALDVPDIEVGHQETLSPLNALGIKGAGEAGAIPVAAAFAQALEDALDVPGLEILDIPLSPGRLWALVQQAASSQDTAR